MFDKIFFAIWIFLPVAFSNMAPVFAMHIPVLKNYWQPLDFGYKFRGHRIFGEHKTIRGLISAIFLSLVLILLQIQIVPSLAQATSIDWLNSSLEMLADFYDGTNVYLYAILSAFGAILGDAIESFFKRQVGIQPGKSWFPFDQTDYIIGGLVFLLPIIRFSILQIIAVFGLFFVGHLVASYIGYRLKLKDSPI